MAPRPAHLPDALVGLTPDALDVVDDRHPPVPHTCLQFLAGFDRHVRDHRELAVDVELELIGGCVADSDRLRALVTGELVELVLGQAPLPADPVHDLQLGGITRHHPQEVVAKRLSLLEVPAADQSAVSASVESRSQQWR
jgi:hypothetical protein